MVLLVKTLVHEGRMKQSMGQVEQDSIEEFGQHHVLEDNKWCREWRI
jgi:hypothetical protein